MIYEYQTTVNIGDTNAMQNMYFLNFFKLQGIVRELWVKDCVQGGMQDLAEGMLLITKDAQCDFKKDFYLYDEIQVCFQFTKVGKTYANLSFEYFNTKTHELHAVGTQTIVFANKDHKVTRIPENWLAAIESYRYEDLLIAC